MAKAIAMSAMGGLRTLEVYQIRMSQFMRRVAKIVSAIAIACSCLVALTGAIVATSFRTTGPGISFAIVATYFVALIFQMALFIGATLMEGKKPSSATALYGAAILLLPAQLAVPSLY